MAARTELLQPTDRNVRDFRTVLADDYRRIGISSDTVKDILPPEELLKARMEAGRKKYYGYRVEEELAAVACVAKWATADQEPFETPLKRTAMKLQRNFLPHTLNDSGFEGLFAFGISESFPDYNQTAKPFLDVLLSLVASRGNNGLKVPVDRADEELTDYCERYGKRITPRVGTIAINTMQREFELYELTHQSQY